MKKNDEGRRYRCGSSFADRLICHHSASTAQKIQFWATSAQIMKIGPSSTVKPLSALSIIV